MKRRTSETVELEQARAERERLLDAMTRAREAYQQAQRQLAAAERSYGEAHDRVRRLERAAAKVQR